MFNIPITLTFKVDLQTQQFITQSLETLRSFLMLYTPADVQALAELKASLDQSKAKVVSIDPSPQPKASNP